MKILEIKKLKKFYDGKLVLDVPHFEVQQGEEISLLGFSGAGKTTLIRAIAGIEKEDEGVIIVNGANNFTYTPQDYCKQVGMVFQDHALFGHLTALENCTIAQMRVLKKTRTEAEELATHLLNRVGMSEHLHKLPKQLSGGQKQRVAIARTMTMQPKILLLDEPLSALDATNKNKFSELIESIRDEGVTIIMVSHDVEYARANSSRCVFMSAGKIIEDLQTEEFFSSEGTIEKADYLNSTKYTRRNHV
ncbi:amino acid ABC transporter ATP-binding protein [Aquitalea pelogenes]|uniref:amino acid ABC transporter ATP-binding protein n=1 Tax=Aquitalea pelogenes TaxID=1293573 RepID=UPI0035B28037